MVPEVKSIVDSAKDGMEKSVSHLESELVKIRAGKANPIMLSGITVDAYGSQMPLDQLGSVIATDPRTITIDPYDKGLIGTIASTIQDAGLGFNPQNDGTLIRVPVPSLTEERRKNLVKNVKDEGENAKISIRNVRRDHNDQLKKLKDEGVSEDAIKDGEGEVQSLTDSYGKQVDDIIKKKEGEIMTV